MENMRAPALPALPNIRVVILSVLGQSSFPAGSNGVHGTAFQLQSSAKAYTFPLPWMEPFLRLFYWPATTQ